MRLVCLDRFASPTFDVGLTATRTNVGCGSLPASAFAVATPAGWFSGNTPPAGVVRSPGASKQLLLGLESYISVHRFNENFELSARRHSVFEK